jgi:hypothetical protein
LAFQMRVGVNGYSEATLVSAVTRCQALLTLQVGRSRVGLTLFRGGKLGAVSEAEFLVRLAEATFVQFHSTNVIAKVRASLPTAVVPDSRSLAVVKVHQLLTKEAEDGQSELPTTLTALETSPRLRESTLPRFDVWQGPMRASWYAKIGSIYIGFTGPPYLLPGSPVRCH